MGRAPKVITKRNQKSLAEKVENLSSVLETETELQHFPAKLRKIAIHIFEQQEPLTVTEACEALGYKRHSMYSMITRARKKGHDFHKFINGKLLSHLNNNKMRVGKSLVNEAVSGSHNHQKLYFQLTGDLKEQQVNTQVNLTIGVNTIASKPTDTTEDGGIIDIQPVIPEDAS